MDPSRRHTHPQQQAPPSSGNPGNNRVPSTNHHHALPSLGLPGAPVDAAARLAAAASASSQSRASASSAVQHFAHSQGGTTGGGVSGGMPISSMSQRLQSVPHTNAVNPGGTTSASSTTSPSHYNGNAATAALHHAYGNAQAQWGVPNPLAIHNSRQSQSYSSNPSPMHAAPSAPSMQPPPPPQASPQNQQQRTSMQQQQQQQRTLQQQQSQKLHQQQQRVQQQYRQLQQKYSQHQAAQAQQQQQQRQHQHHQQQQARYAQQQQQARGGAQMPGQAPVKKKVILSPEAKQALAKAIWSAIRSPTGTVAPELMQAALRTGLPQHAILNAARVAREREAMKRRGVQPPPMTSTSSASRPTNMMSTSRSSHLQQPKPMPQPMSTSNYMRSNMAMPAPSVVQHRHSAPVPPVPTHQQQHYHHHHQRHPKQPPRQPPPQQQPQQFRVPPTQHVKPPPSKPTVPAPAPPSVDAKLKNIERAKWRRVQHGIFTIQKDRFVALPFSVGCISRTLSTQGVISGPPRQTPANADAGIMRNEALILQQRYLAKGNRRPNPTSLLDPDSFKRVRMEPKKHGRALDRAARKARQSTSESLIKQQKEVHKLLGSHQTEFFKFHRSRKMEVAKLCKAIREAFEKEEKKREKDQAQAEKARLAALRANDMTAYSKLLEETKNDRLKYLLDKTEKHFTQISSLLQNRSADDTQASASKTSDGGGNASYYASAHVHNEEVRQPSILVGGDLKEYQLTGLQWLVSLYNNKLNGILADEMGLGKTIQAISLCAYLMEFKQNLGPYLVIVPLSTLSNWSSEFSKWLPSARLVCYKGTPTVRRDIYKDQVRAGHFNVLLTTYEYIIKDKKFLRKIDWQYAIVDEGHRMKNSQSKFAVTLSTQYNTNYRVLLTGTPLMNDLSELWSLLNFLLPNIFNSAESFDQWFSRPFSQFGESKSDDGADDYLSNEERILIIHRLHELLRPFMLRRVKSEVLDQLPEKVEKVLRCDLSSWQKELYKQISRKAAADPSIISQQGPARGLNNVVMQLRKVCNHPYLFSPEGYNIDDSIVRSSAKMALLDQMLPKLKRAGHRVLMFTQMTAVMTIMEDYFALRGFLSLRLDGSTPAEEREKRMFKFNAPDSPYFIFLLSTRAGGLGLNLTAADTVIIFDSDWNPMMDLQAQDRAHRIGQRSDVSVFRLITNSPVEEKILSRANEKLSVSELVVESGKFNKDSVESDNSLERKKMMEVLLTDFDGARPSSDKEKLSDVGDEDDEEASGDGSEKEDLNELLSNNEDDYQLYAAMDEEYEGGVGVPLYTEDADVPSWILHPPEVGAAMAAFVSPSLIEGSRKRKNVTYDDGLTEKQFLRMMERKAIEEEKSKKKARTSKSPVAAGSAASSTSPIPEEGGDEGPGGHASGLTDWTYRKLITCSKAVVALKDPATKRRLSDIFIEKPDPSQFPDYYEIIEKPIAINDILRKCRAKLYADLQEFKADWSLMFANARKFNGDDSWVVEDATSLQKELERVLKKNGFSDESVPISKKKKLRIKLSLKDIKGTEEANKS